MGRDQLVAVHAEHEARYAAAVMYDTWGHLEPNPGTYTGWLVFANGVHGDKVAVDWDFSGLEACPGVYDDMMDYIYATCESREVGVYRLDGSYRRFKNGKGRFAGRVISKS